MGAAGLGILAEPRKPERPRGICRCAQDAVREIHMIGLLDGVWLDGTRRRPSSTDVRERGESERLGAEGAS